MNFVARILLLSCLLPSLLFADCLVFAKSSTKASRVLISTSHKFTPGKDRVSEAKKRVLRHKNSGSLVLITQGRSFVKRRPVDYELMRLLSTNMRRKLSAKSAIIMDAVSGRAVYAQSADLPGQPASTIKVLTGIIAIDSLKKNEMVPVSRRAARMPRSKVYLRAGKAYPANDLVNAVLLASANDASVALAEKIAGSEKSFARLMTSKAKSFGATRTVCKTANGLTARGQKSTVRDLARIFNGAMRNNQFARKMARTKVRTREGKLIRSHNRALWRVDGAEGGKTGYTNVARQTYVGKFKRGSDEIVVAIMGSETMWKDVKCLVEYGFAKKVHDRHLLVNASTVSSEHQIKLVQLDRAVAGNANQVMLLTKLSKRRSL